jgi:peptide/nickel transport system substrate-binding protein
VTSSSAVTIPNKTLTAVFNVDVVNLNPVDWFTISDLDVLQLVYNTLVEVNSTGLPSPGLANSWTISPNGTVYTFNIVHNAMWQDGVPVNASDVAFTLNYWVKYPPNYYGPMVGVISGAKATGPYTVQVVLKHPYSGFLLDLADLGMIIPQHIWAPITAPKNATNLIGDGPFSFVSRTPGVDVVLKANPSYWLGPPHFQYLVIKIITSVDASVAAVQSGSVNLFELPPGTNLASFQSYANVNVATTPSTMIWYVTMNTQTFPFNNTDVRQAMAYAIDQSSVISLSFAGQGYKASSVISPALAFWYNPRVANYTFNAKAAVAALRAGGFSNSTGTWMDSKGRVLTFTLTIANEAPYVEWAAVIDQNLASIGITVNIQAVDPSTQTNEVLLQHTYQMSMDAWRLYFDPLLFLQPSFASVNAVPNGIDFSLFKNATVDNLINEAGNQTTLAAEKPFILQIQTDVAQQVPWIMESYGQDIWTVQGFSGWQPVPRYGLWYYSTFLNLTPNP